MAIHAEVKVRRLVASATSRRLFVEASRPTFAAVISERSLSISTNYRQLQPEISYRQLYASPSWRQLFLHDVHVNAERTLYFFTDEQSITDSHVFSIEPSLFDSTSMLESHAIDFGKDLSDQTENDGQPRLKSKQDSF